MTIRCPTCDTEQDVSAGSASRCLACGKDLTAEVAAAAESSPEAKPTAVPLGQPEAARLVAALPTRPSGPPTGPFAELHRGETVYEYLIALVPVLGILRVARSEVLTPAKRALALALALTSTVVVAYGAWSIAPRTVPPEERSHSTVTAELADLRTMILEYRKQTGSFPDAEMWRQSVATAESGLYDPWGRPYLYENGKGAARVGTLGRDGVAGGEGEDADRFVSLAEEKQNT